MFKRAFVIDDDAVFRLGLSQVLANEYAIDTVGSVDLRRNCCAAVSEARADLVILSPTAIAPESIAWMRQLLSSPREFLVVMLLGQQAAATTRELAGLGADGFLMKPVALAALSNLIGAIRRNHGAQDVSAADGLIPTGYPCNSEVRSLSDRELLVVRRTADGQSSAQIAAEFGISIKTAERYRRAIFSKLGLQSVAELTKFAVREGYTAL